MTILFGMALMVAIAVAVTVLVMRDRHEEARAQLHAREAELAADWAALHAAQRIHRAAWSARQQMHGLAEGPADRRRWP